MLRHCLTLYYRVTLPESDWTINRFSSTMKRLQLESSSFCNDPSPLGLGRVSVMPTCRSHSMTAINHSVMSIARIQKVVMVLYKYSRQTCCLWSLDKPIRLCVAHTHTRRTTLSGRILYQNVVSVKRRNHKIGKNCPPPGIGERFSGSTALFLTDRTNGRAYATVLRLSVCPSVRRLWRYVLWLNGAS